MFKKRNRTLLTLLVLTLILVTPVLSCCDKIDNLKNNEIETGEKSVLVIIGNEEYSVKTDAIYVHDLLIEMISKKGISYEYEEGSYGATILKLNDLETATDWSTYVSVFHNINDVTLRADFGEFAMEDALYNGETFYPSSCGVSSLIVKDGAKYYFKQI